MGRKDKRPIKERKFAKDSGFPVAHASSSSGSTPSANKGRCVENIEKSFSGLVIDESAPEPANAPFETRHTMGHSIRALCNADLRSGFRLGIDVSLPETNVVSPLNPLRGLGGSPATKRHTLAFFAGKMHGGLRPKLLRHWENKDSDMKIFGLLPGGENKRKMDYIRYMKTSKYCICPRGHEVNSPRVIEAIFYECVPVIVSNNYVLPLFEVLNWEAFSVVVPEKHVPRLKQILESIPEEKYIALQKGVRKVQKHFLWHSKPVKYDLFHMILHSIWFNRVHQM